MDIVISGLNSLMDPVVILLMCIGVIIGIIIGSLPGLTDPMALGLAVPFTFGMEPVAAILFLLALHFGAVYGGSITAILKIGRASCRERVYMSVSSGSLHR